MLFADHACVSPRRDGGTSVHCFTRKYMDLLQLAPNPACMRECCEIYPEILEEVGFSEVICRTLMELT